MIELNQTVPDFSFQATNQLSAQINDFKGKKIILYFYPKDATPGCTLEGQHFRDAYEEFVKNNSLIFGVSKDSLASHEKFKQKHQFPFELIADIDGSLCQLFDVIKEKNLYGRKYMGIERSTFIIDEQGLLRHAFRKVKVQNHIAELLSLIKQG